MTTKWNLSHTHTHNTGPLYDQHCTQVTHTPTCVCLCMYTVVIIHLFLISEYTLSLHRNRSDSKTSIRPSLFFLLLLNIVFLPRLRTRFGETSWKRFFYGGNEATKGKRGRGKRKLESKFGWSLNKGDCNQRYRRNKYLSLQVITIFIVLPPSRNTGSQSIQQLRKTIFLGGQAYKKKKRNKENKKKGTTSRHGWTNDRRYGGMGML